MSRANLEDVIAYNFRTRSGSWGTVEFALTGPFVVPVDAPLGYLLNPNGSDRNVVLPAITAQTQGRYLFLAHTGSANLLEVFNSLGATVATLEVDDTALLLASRSEWVVLQGVGQSILAALHDLFRAPMVVTGAVATIADNVSKVVVKRVNPTATTLNLPMVVGRGSPLMISDLSTGIISAGGHTITLTPSGAENVMGLSSYPLFSPSGLTGDVGSAAVTLWPVPAENQWIVT